METNLKGLLTFCLALTFLSACGSDHDSGHHKSSPHSPSNNPSEMESATFMRMPESTDFQFPELDGGNLDENSSGTSLKLSYRLVQNGCDTGKHEFSGNDVNAVRKQYCDALQDEQLNKGCAEPLRFELFKKRCKDYNWSPK